MRSKSHAAEMLMFQLAGISKALKEWNDLEALRLLRKIGTPSAARRKPEFAKPNHADSRGRCQYRVPSTTKSLRQPDGPDRPHEQASSLFDTRHVDRE
jgi:hypothetical protein